MAIMTARQGQHDLIQYLKNPKERERHAIDNPPRADGDDMSVNEAKGQAQEERKR